MKNAGLILAVIIVLLAGYYLLSGQGNEQSTQPSPTAAAAMDASRENENMNQNTNQAKQLAMPEMMINAQKDYKAVLKTDLGDITIDLHEKETPITVNNFVYLAKEGYYDGFPFHRVIDGFMIQGGDPTGTGMGNPGYEFDNESFTGDYTRGTVAMANAGRDTNGSQFFILHADYPLPKDYVIFGNVSEGIDIVDKIATAEVAISQSGERSKPVNPVTVTSVEIIEE